MVIAIESVPPARKGVRQSRAKQLDRLGRDARRRRSWFPGSRLGAYFLEAPASFLLAKPTTLNFSVFSKALSFFAFLKALRRGSAAHKCLPASEMQR